jgi:thiol-disulfide isomerase/thioredoxin
MRLLVENLRLLVVAVTAILLAVVAAPVGARTPGEVPIGAVLRDAQMEALIGPSRKLSDFRNKPLLINVWASWCGPCRDEMGSLERLARRYGGKQFHVIGISTDDYRDRASGFLKAYKITFPNFIDHALLLENMLGADHLPLTLLIDAQGKVLGKYYGSREWDSPEAARLISTSFKLSL